MDLPELMQSSSTEGHLRCFQDCAVTNNAVTNNFVCESLHMCTGIAVGYIPRSGTVLSEEQFPYNFAI